MNEETSSLKTNIHNAEEWVSMARKFGVDCAAIQHDAALSLEQRFEKQLLLAKEIVENIWKEFNESLSNPIKKYNFKA